MSAPWTDLGGGVLVRQSAAFQMNSVALLHPEHAVLVDPGVLGSELDDFAARVAQAGPAKVTLVLAHGRFAEVVRRDEQRIRSEIEALAREHGERWDRGFTAFRPTQAVSGLH